jgi:ribosomal protein S18 acetylase RimI-like enzyme
MNDFIRDLTKTSLISAIEENQFAFFSTFGQWPRAEFHDETEIKWSMTDVPFPMFNSIMRAQLAPERIKATIQSIVSQAKTRNLPLLWWTGPATQPPDLGSHLEKNGFTRGEQMQGMAVGLAKLDENVPMPTGLTVRLVEDNETLKQWCQVFVTGFEMPDFVVDVFYDFMRHVDPDTMQPYLGWLNGQPVATSLLTLAAGVAGIYNVATLPEARRQGIGTIMTLTPLCEARSRGYNVGILQASEVGVSVYRSLGFREYCRIRHYVWLPECQKERRTK